MTAPDATRTSAHRTQGAALRHLSTALVVLVLGTVAFTNPALLVDHWIYVSIGLAALACVVGAQFFWPTRLTLQDRAAALIAPVNHDPQPRYIVSADGDILARNAIAMLETFAQDTLNEVLNAQMFDSSDFIQRLQEAVMLDGYIDESIVSRQGSSKVEVTYLDPGLFLWTLNTPVSPDQLPARGLDLPMLTVAESGTILFMNTAARTYLGERKTKLSDVFTQAHYKPSDLNVIHSKSGSSSCFVFEKDLSSDRKEIFLVPAQEQETYALTFDDMPIAMLKTNLNGTVVLVNKSAREMLGEPLSQAQHLTELFEGLGRPLQNWISEVADGRAANSNEYLRLKRDDKETHVQVTLNCQYEDGKAHLVALLNDATELQTLQAQFTQSQKMQAIGQLAGGIAHDFNNLLTAISGHCDLLLLKHDQCSEDYPDLMQINQNTDRAAGLVKQLLAYSRKQTLQPITLDLRDSLNDLTQLLNRLVGETVQLQVHHEPQLKYVNVDRQQFEQVVMNLVVNARDAMPEGGRIEILTENLRLASPNTRDNAVVPAGEYVSVRVTDQGVGISRDKKRKVFEPFYTTKRTGEGTGLGLSTAYGIVKQSGGFIFLDSVVGEGSTFTLLFPATDLKPKQIQESQPSIDIQASESGVVLLVEDEAPVRAFASRALQLKGLTVLEADSSEHALSILQDQELRIDLFVSDVIMPGLDGPSWVKKARETYPDTHVIFMSGYSQESIAETRETINNATFLPKPFSLVQLSEAVQEQIEKSRNTVE